MNLITLFFLFISTLNFLIILFLLDIKDYQSLIAGLLALLAAILTVSVMFYIEENKRRKKNKAAKAMLSHGLSRICRYTEESTKWLYQLCELNKLHKHKVRDYLNNYPSPPQLPQHIYDWISNAIEYSDNKKSEQSIEKLASELQVHTARVESINTSIKNPSEILTNDWPYQVILHAMELYSRASELLKYTRDNEKITFKEYVEIRSFPFLDFIDSNLNKMIENHNASIK